MLSFFNPFQTFFFLKRRFEKLANPLVPQTATIAMTLAVGVDRGMRERRKGKETDVSAGTSITVPRCRARCPSGTDGVLHWHTLPTATQMLSALRFLLLGQTPHLHTAFPSSYLVLPGNSHSSKTQRLARGNSAFGQHKCKYTFVSSGVRLS